MNAPAEKGGPTTYLANNSKIGANCFKHPMNCLFSDGDLKDVSCPGLLVKIKGTAQDKQLACMNKCMSTDFESEEECQN